MRLASFSVAALAGAATLAVGHGVQAQPQSSVDWNGVYVGANAGWRGSTERTDPSSASVNQLTGVNNGSGVVVVPATGFTVAGSRMHSSTGTWGGQVGFNVQRGPWVFGAEGDMDAAYGRRTQISAYSLPPTALTSANTVTVGQTVDPRWTASLRGRVGYATGPLLLYGTGGLAILSARLTEGYIYAPTVTGAVAAANPGTAFGPYSNGGRQEVTRAGWTVGGGGEFALSEHLSIGAEYRHSDYGHQTVGVVTTAPNSVSNLTHIGFRDDALLAKINFRFGSGVR